MKNIHICIVLHACALGVCVCVFESVCKRAAAVVVDSTRWGHLQISQMASCKRE